MRILWFTNSPSLAAKKVSKSYNVGGGWIESLEKAFHSLPDVQLGIAFSWLSQDIKHVKVEGSPTDYYMLPRYPAGKFGRFIQRVTCSLESKKALKDYLEVVDTFRPDVIHFFGTETNYPQIIPQLKVPSVIWFQGNLKVYQMYYQSGLSLWKTMWFEKITNILNGESYLHDFYLRAKQVKREEEIFSYTTNFTGRTDWDRRLVSVLAPQSNYFYCDEVMRSPFYKYQWVPHASREKFVIVSTIGQNLYKGLETIMETSKWLSKIVPKEVEWRVVGVIPDSTYVRAARYKAKLSGSDQNIQLLGFKSAQELAEELLNADVYVHPSHIENSPNSVCEAMLLGLPIVATSVGGVPNLIDDKEDGFLVQSGDSCAMAGAIADIYRDPDNAITMGISARNRGQNRHDIRKIISDLTKVYKQLINHVPLEFPNKKIR